MNPLPVLSPTRLSLVIPLFNEEESLPPLIDAVFASLGKESFCWELVLVEDGSQDRTAELAARYCAADARIRLIRHDRNRGLGAAIRTGLQAAEGEFVLYTDADLPFDFHLIPELLARATPQRVVIGCRANRGEGGRRWILSKGYNLLTRLVLGVWVRDVNFACKLLPRKAVRGMRLESEGSFIDAEMLLECRRLGLGIIELPMQYYPRQYGQSTLSRPSVIWGILRELTRYLWRNLLPQRGKLQQEADQEP